MQQSTSEMSSNQDIHVHACMVQATQNTTYIISLFSCYSLHIFHLLVMTEEVRRWPRVSPPWIVNPPASPSSRCCSRLFLTADRCSRLLNAVALEAAKLKLILHHVLATHACAYSAPRSLRAHAHIQNHIPPTNPL